MEEKKKPQDVKTATQQRQLTYEELNNIAHQLSEQNLQLRRQLQSTEAVNFFKRLDYLFKVVELEHAFSEEFTASCIAEIETAITIPQKGSDMDKKSSGTSDDMSKSTLESTLESTSEGDIDEDTEEDDEDNEDEELEGIHP